MIRVIDYGLGNVQAFLNAYKLLDIDADRATAPPDIDGASHLVLPGVGSFDLAIQLFEESGMRDAVEDAVLHRNVPILGVCVGMQILASSSEEGTRGGLDWIPGSVRKIVPLKDGEAVPLPHMGWNEISIKRVNPLLCSLGPSPDFYFLHSYCFVPDDNNTSIAEFHYGCDMVCAVQCNNIFGVQFHPEKSHDNGLSLLKNFSSL